MTDQSNKPYRIDGHPVTVRELCDAAKDYDELFGQDGLLQTSVAAQILRSHGHKVDENPAAA